ncbi:DUF2520 domain-containing protein [Myxococcota bacterium]|nr:DUF2520 domain-containing protein [Myxococcota bacterium]MBU1900411.1 DUF2520 domain-containing protein [Myxococcota bacterium]
MRKRNIVLYGGAFDPPHLAHLFAVTALLSREGVDEVWLLPTADHVFGKDMAPFEARIAWLEAATAPLGARVKISRFEAERAGLSRTYDTLDALSARHPDAHFAFAIGADNLAAAHRWYRFEALRARWPLIVFGRPGAPPPTPAHHIEPSPTLPDVSSTALRAALRSGLESEALLWLPSRIRAAVAAYYTPQRAALGPVFIFGTGRAGGAFAEALRRAGVEVEAVDARATPPTRIEAPIWMLAVPDEVIAPLAAQLATRPEAAGRVVLHLAGRLGREILAPLAAVGAHTGGLHPLQALNGPSSDLRDVYCGLEGDEIALEAAAAICRAVGARGAPLPIADKAAYHAAAVFSANFITALGEGGLRILEALGIARDEALGMLSPLQAGTVAQLKDKGGMGALTGPLARVDLEAVAAHLDALRRRAPETLPAYVALARLTARLAGWPEARRASLDEILAAAGDPHA